MAKSTRKVSKVSRSGKKKVAARSRGTATQSKSGQARVFTKKLDKTRNRHPAESETQVSTQNQRKIGEKAGRRIQTRRRSEGDEPTLVLIKALERVIAHGHPWVYRDAVAGLNGGDFSYPAGTVVDLLDQRGRFLARGLSEDGAIAMRIWLRARKPLDPSLFATRLEEALDLRDRLELGDSDCIRCINGEGDRIPGLICDRYADIAIAKVDTESLLAWNPSLWEQLWKALQKRGVQSLAQLSGRGPTRRLVALYGEIPQTPFAVRERGMKLVVDLNKGQKTGLFLDHRPQRHLLRKLCEAWRAGKAGPLRVLNLYGYTGGFSVAAGLGGATEVVTVDLSAGALAMAEQSWSANGLEAKRHRAVCAKAEDYLANPPSLEFPEEFEMVVADPPSFAPNQRSLKKALGAYRAMHRACLSRVVEGGYYLSASCSSHVTREAFEESLREGAHGAGVELQVLGRGEAGADHPVPLGFSQGNYLCATWCRVFHKKARKAE